MSGWVGESGAGTAASSAAVAVVRTQVVKHADEAANAHQIFIRPGEAVQLVKEDEIRWGGQEQSLLPLRRCLATFYRLIFLLPPNSPPALRASRGPGGCLVF